MDVESLSTAISPTNNVISRQERKKLIPLPKYSNNNVVEHVYYFLTNNVLIQVI